MKSKLKVLLTMTITIFMVLCCNISAFANDEGLNLTEYGELSETKVQDLGNGLVCVQNVYTKEIPVTGLLKIADDYKMQQITNTASIKESVTGGTVLAQFVLVGNFEISKKDNYAHATEIIRNTHEFFDNRFKYTYITTLNFNNQGVLTKYGYFDHQFKFTGVGGYSDNYSLKVGCYSDGKGKLYDLKKIS